MEDAAVAVAAAAEYFGVVKNQRKAMNVMICPRHYCCHFFFQKRVDDWMIA